MDSKVGGSGSLKSEINVTPLVDVCLVLLIIFMVVAPLLVNPRAELPETVNPERMPKSPKQLDVSIDQGGKVFVDDKWVPAEQLLAELREIHDRAAEGKVVINGDRSLPFGKVRSVMRTVAQAGYSGAGLAMQRKEPAD